MRRGGGWGEELGLCSQAYSANMQQMKNGKMQPPSSHPPPLPQPQKKKRGGGGGTGGAGK